MKKYMIADLIKDISTYPKTISFTMQASGGKWRGTFGINHPDADLAGPASIEATHIANTDLYDVIVTFSKPYPGPYKYLMPYDVLLKWEQNSKSGSWYNANIRGNSKYFPDKAIS
jgi:hypothetical protein